MENITKQHLKYSETYRHKIIDTKTVVDYFNTEIGKDLTTIFNQYLNYTSIPILEYKIEKNKIDYRWKTDVSNFKMPAVLKVGSKEIRLDATNDWQSYKVKAKKEEEISFENKRFFIKLSKN